MSRLALVNTNEMKPAIAPIALDYIGGALKRAGYDVSLYYFDLRLHFGIDHGNV